MKQFIITHEDGYGDPLEIEVVATEVCLTITEMCEYEGESIASVEFDLEEAEGVLISLQEAVATARQNKADAQRAGA